MQLQFRLSTKLSSGNCSEYIHILLLIVIPKCRSWRKFIVIAYWMAAPTCLIKELV